MRRTTSTFCCDITRSISLLPQPGGFEGSANEQRLKRRLLATRIEIRVSRQVLPNTARPLDREPQMFDRVGLPAREALAARKVVAARNTQGAPRPRLEPGRPLPRTVLPGRAGRT